MKRLFVDTAGWMAMADRNDPLFTPTRKVRDKWLKEGGTLVTTDYVMDETLIVGIEILKASKKINLKTILSYSLELDGDLLLRNVV